MRHPRACSIEYFFEHSVNIIFIRHIIYKTGTQHFVAFKVCAGEKGVAACLDCASQSFIQAVELLWFGAEGSGPIAKAHDAERTSCDKLQVDLEGGC